MQRHAIRRQDTRVFAHRRLIISINLGGQTPLMRAMTEKKTDFIDLLLKFRVDINHENSFGLTPLCATIQNRNFEMVKYIVKKARSKCDLDLVTPKKGLGAIHFAISNDCIKTVLFLLRAGACPSLPEKEFGNSPAILAVEHKQIDVLKQLVAHGANLNYENYSGHTALTRALMLALHDFVVFLLLEGGADPNFGTIFNPLEICCKTMDENMALLLLKYGANPRLCIVEGINGGGQNLLQTSIDLGWVEVQKFVIHYFSNVINQTKNGLWTTVGK
jgi:ankyrin repeat protein